MRKEFDFNAPAVRRGSGCMKWDEAPDSDVIPLWVADMDFRTAPNIIRALSKRVEHGVFGYTFVDDEYYQILTDWFSSRHGWTFARRQVIYTSGVVPALSAIIKALTRPGDGVIVQTPVYNCFFSSIRNNGCKIIENPLICEESGRGEFTFRIDYDDLQEKVRRQDARILLLCNPHNPAGRVWTAEELRRIAEICREENVTVVSDEIHCELCMPGYSYTPFATIEPSAIVCTSPSKAFNTAGLQIANIVCPDEGTRVKVDRAINDNEVCDVNPFGIVALKASYSQEGEEWLSQLIEYLHGNYMMMKTMLQEAVPDFKVSKLEGTYLPMIDVRAYGMPVENLERELLEEAKVWVNSSAMYGCEGFLRINIATQRQNLRAGISRLIYFFMTE